MVIQKIIQLLAKISLGKEMAMALNVLGLISDTVDALEGKDLVHFIYGKLPRQWKPPAGPATETEFVEMVEAGHTFLRKIKALAQH